MAGHGAPRSLRLWEEIAKQRVHILIDSGSTHNLIQPKLAKKLRINVLPIKAFKVYIGNGDYLVCSHKCPQVPVSMQETKFLVDMYVLTIQGPNMG